MTILNNSSERVKYFNSRFNVDQNILDLSLGEIWKYDSSIVMSDYIDLFHLWTDFSLSNLINEIRQMTFDVENSIMSFAQIILLKKQDDLGIQERIERCE